MPQFTHLDEKGKARMVDVSAKDTTLREAVARGKVLMKPTCASRFRTQSISGYWRRSSTHRAPRSRKSCVPRRRCWDCSPRSSGWRSPRCSTRWCWSRLELVPVSSERLLLVFHLRSGAVRTIFVQVAGSIEPEVVQREDGSWLVDGKLPVDEFKEMFRLSSLPDESRGYYQTLGGFVMSYLGRIPTAADNFDLGDLHFEVMDMDGFRVDKVLVIPLGKDAPRKDED